MVLSPIAGTLNVQAAEAVEKIQVESGQESDVQTEEKQEVSESELVESVQQKVDMAQTEVLNVETDFTYNVLNEAEKTCEITGYTGTDINIVIPDQIAGYKVVEIAAYAFENSQLYEVTIPEGVTAIREGAFYSAKKLRTIRIPATVNIIESRVFYGAYFLSNIYVAEGNLKYSCKDNVLFTKDETEILRASTRLTGDYVVPNTVIKIHDGAFMDSAFDVMTILDNVKYIGFKALAGGHAILTDGQTEAYKYGNQNRLYVMLITRSFGDYDYQITDINKKEISILNYKGIDTKVIVPKTISDYTVIEIGQDCFWNCEQLTEVILPSNIISIGINAFSGCINLTKIDLPTNLRKIEYGAFSYCEKVSYISLGENVSQLEENAFYGCKKVEKYDVSPNNVTYTSVDGILMDKNKTKIIQYPSAKKETTYTVPVGVIHLGDAAFLYSHNLTEVILPETVEFIGSDTFSGCTGLKDVKLPASVTTIGDHAFSGCTGLKDVKLPASVTTIGDCAFSGCAGLKDVLLPASVTTLGSGVFSNCTSLQKINVAEENSKYSSWNGMLFNKDKTQLIQCGAGMQGDVVIPEGVIDLEWDTFSNCNLITSITIPSSLTSWHYSMLLGEMINAFNVSEANPEYSSKEGILYNKDFTKLVKVPCGRTSSYTMPETVQWISGDAFEGCSKLQDITLSSMIGRIDHRKFEDCKSLKNIYVSEANQTYSSREGILYNKDETSLELYPKAGNKDYVVPDSVTTIEYAALYGCDLNSVTLPSKLETIGTMAFLGNDFKKVTIPESVTAIWDRAIGYYEVEPYLTKKIEGFTICGKPGTAAETYAKENGFTFEEAKPEQPEPPKFELQGSSMVLGNNLNFESYISTDQLNGRTDVYAKVTKEYADGRPAVTQKVPYKDWKDGEKPGLKYVEFIGVSAKEMMDEVNVQVFDNDDQPLSEKSADSIHDYALRMLQDETSSDALKTLLVDMLNYGAACQTYFNYNPANLANRDIDAYQSYATKEIVCTNSRENGKCYVGTSLITKSNIKMVMYFKNLTKDMKAVVTFKNHRGKDLSFTVEGKDFELYQGMQGVIIDKLAVADVSQPVKCEILDKDGTVVTTVTDSMESYVARMGKDESVFNSIMKFGTSSHAFFHSK